jgi:hypothetical protein
MVFLFSFAAALVVKSLIVSSIGVHVIKELVIKGFVFHVILGLRYVVANMTVTGGLHSS